MARRKDPHAAALGRKGGKKGGKARWEGVSAEERTLLARRAAEVRWGHRRAVAGAGTKDRAQHPNRENQPAYRAIVLRRRRERFEQEIAVAWSRVERDWVLPRRSDRRSPVVVLRDIANLIPHTYVPDQIAVDYVKVVLMAAFGGLEKGRAKHLRDLLREALRRVRDDALPPDYGGIRPRFTYRDHERIQGAHRRLMKLLTKEEAKQKDTAKSALKAVEVLRTINKILAEDLGAGGPSPLSGASRVTVDDLEAALKQEDAYQRALEILTCSLTPSPEQSRKTRQQLDRIVQVNRPDR